MSVYPKSAPSDKIRRKEKLATAGSRTKHLQQKGYGRKNSKITKIKSPSSNLPSWLKSFRVLQASSSFLVLCLIGSTLFVYSWTVSTQQTWGKQYENLEKLQRQERDLTATNESIKNKLVEDTNPEKSDLVPITPEQVLFLKSTNKDKSELKKTQATTNSAAIRRPLGY